MSSNLAQNLQWVQEKIRRSAERTGKTAEDITLVAVTKTFPADLINRAVELGVRHIGENRVQEAREKFPHLRPGITRHLIGHLQRNKVKYAVNLFDVIQSVDRISLAEEINARCAKMKREMPVLIQVNTSREPQKFGCEPEEALTLLRAMDRLPYLKVRGFMTIAIFSEDPEKVRPCFQLLREIFEESRRLNLPRSEITLLSMGMSSDFEIAIEEGANMVRIGSAIFGSRNGKDSKIFVSN